MPCQRTNQLSGTALLKQLADSAVFFRRPGDLVTYPDKRYDATVDIFRIPSKVSSQIGAVELPRKVCTSRTADPPLANHVIHSSLCASVPLSGILLRNFPLASLLCATLIQASPEGNAFLCNQEPSRGRRGNEGSQVTRCSSLFGSKASPLSCAVITGETF